MKRIIQASSGEASALFRSYTFGTSPFSNLLRGVSSTGITSASSTDAPKSPITYRNSDVHVTPAQKREKAGEGSHVLSHPIYSQEYVDHIPIKHRTPVRFNEKIGFKAVTLLRTGFDKVTGYGPDMNIDKYLTRFIFLESVAAVPGMVGGALRHLRSLRLMAPDRGWIHCMLQEAENERLHLLTFLQLKQPGFLTRAGVLFAQGVFWNLYFFCYLLYPKACHSFVGYLEEEAVKTYTHALEDLDAGRLPEWSDRKAPAIAVEYWKLKKDATMRDVLLAVRADEYAHQYVNHTLSDLKADENSPFSLDTHEHP